MNRKGRKEKIKIKSFALFVPSVIRKMTENEISKIIIGAAIKVHKTLGPGLLESVYEICLFKELRDLGKCIKTSFCTCCI